MKLYDPIDGIRRIDHIYMVGLVSINGNKVIDSVADPNKATYYIFLCQTGQDKYHIITDGNKYGMVFANTMDMEVIDTSTALTRNDLAFLIEYARTNQIKEQYCQTSIVIAGFDALGIADRLMMDY